MKKLFIIISILINASFVFAIEVAVSSWAGLDYEYRFALLNNVDTISIGSDISFTGATNIDTGLPQNLTIRGWNASSSTSVKLNGEGDSIGGYGGFYILGGKTIKFENISFNKFYRDDALDGIGWGEGGAVMITGLSSVTFSGGALEFTSNSATNSGGALCIYGARYVMFSGGGIKFENNISSADGGAIFAIGSGAADPLTIVINAVNGNVLFNNNISNAASAAGGEANDIHIVDNTILELNAADRKTIEMRGGISSDYSNNLIKKMGDGKLIFGENARVNFKGDFNIEKGEVKIKAPVISINVLNVEANGKLSLTSEGSSFAQHKIFVGSATVAGIFDIGLDISKLNSDPDHAGDMLISSDTITINKAVLTISLFGENSSTGSIKIMQSVNGIINWDALVVVGNNIHYNYRAYYDENNKFLSLNISPVPTPPAPPVPPAPAPNPNESVSVLGNFLANSLTVPKSAYIDDIYNRLKTGGGNEGNVWFGLYGNGKSIDNFNISGFGAALGIDTCKTQNLTAGIFIRYGSNNMKEENNKGSMTEKEIGLYGGIFNMKDKFNLKGNLSAAFQSYNIETDGNISFDGKSINEGLELEYIAAIYETINIKPFVGFQSAYVMNDEIKAQTFSIPENSFTRLEGKIGLGLDGKLGKNQTFYWYSRLYAILLASGDGAAYKVKKDDGSNNGEIQSVKEGFFKCAISLGGDYSVNEFISMFINAGAQFGNGFGWTGGIGANYKF
ncbi:MAG: autotransporter outer membrane beta-barrel domain-containing protein [Elusimicrobiota bacterium]|jgi:predicted outer membrane repeat protein|nr:autotransporter outer membrane beta-barrel domain-containing protein [Elusimicrobiota bacterium]